MYSATFKKQRMFHFTWMGGDYENREGVVSSLKQRCWNKQQETKHKHGTISLWQTENKSTATKPSQKKCCVFLSSPIALCWFPLYLTDVTILLFPHGESCTVFELWSAFRFELFLTIWTWMQQIDSVTCIMFLFISQHCKNVRMFFLRSITWENIHEKKNCHIQNSQMLILNSLSQKKKI